MRTIITTLLISCVLGTLTGCGNRTASQAERGYKAAGIAEVTGTITLDGQPLSHAQIQFSENERLGSSFCYGVTDTNGKYRMRIDSHRTGALPGDKIVRVWTTLRGNGINELMQGTYQDKEIIPIRYNRESELSVTVELAKRQTFNFDLESGGKVNPAAAPTFGETDADGQ
jgi:hypothetical protein